MGRYFEARAKGQTSAAIKKLMGLAPRTARVVRGDQEVDVPLEQVVAVTCCACAPATRCR